MIRRRHKEGKKLGKIILFWLPFIVYISIIPPSAMISFLGFYVLLSLSLFFTCNLFLTLGRTLVWIMTIILYLLLRQFHLDNIINTLILLGIFITFEVYFRKA